MFTVFRRLQIQARITLGFTAVIVIGMAVAGYCLHGLDDVGQQVRVMNTLGSSVIRVLTVSQTLESIRRAENRYQLDGDPGSLAEIETNVAEAELILESAPASPIPYRGGAPTQGCWSRCGNTRPRSPRPPR